jgi:hypothetical protein
MEVAVEGPRAFLTNQASRPSVTPVTPPGPPRDRRENTSRSSLKRVTFFLPPLPVAQGWRTDPR